MHATHTQRSHPRSGARCTSPSPAGVPVSTTEAIVRALAQEQSAQSAISDYLAYPQSFGNGSELKVLSQGQAG